MQFLDPRPNLKNDAGDDYGVSWILRKKKIDGHWIDCVVDDGYGMQRMLMVAKIHGFYSKG
jgi:hypothetical protein